MLSAGLHESELSTSFCFLFAAVGLLRKSQLRRGSCHIITFNFPYVQQEESLMSKVTTHLMHMCRGGDARGGSDGAAAGELTYHALTSWSDEE